ncbi:helix-turn-helix transcriptional regulator [Enterococcus sp. UD-01]|jgi:predicted DNA-binding transcriptional regulator YafY|uniref:helix-turn-helix transcriptional regulator n=1 Tax=Enterococcus sp. UD-01 TaxID=3373911 RepID=UPI0038392A86
MQIQRLFEIVYLLLNKKKMTASELAAHFEVSRRTILRDIETLSMAGIPVYTTRGKGGGIFLLEEFVLNKATLTSDEQKQLLLGLQSLAAAQTVDTEPILSKLNNLFANQEAEWIEVDFSSWSNPEIDQARFSIIKRAILKRQILTFRYIGRYQQTTERRVCPVRLVFKAKAWYLKAYCLEKKAYRLFKLTRMQEAALSAKQFQLQKLPSESAEPVTSPKLISLTLAFSSASAYRLYDEFDSRKIQECADGSFILKTQLPHDQWLYSY